jgi:phage-related holin
LRFDEFLVKEALAAVAAVSGLFFGGSEISVILLSVVRADGGACPFLLKAQLGVMLVVKRWATSFFF